jgi:hypothetical protein
VVGQGDEVITVVAVELADDIRRLAAVGAGAVCMQVAPVPLTGVFKR